MHGPLRFAICLAQALRLSLAALTSLQRAPTRLEERRRTVLERRTLARDLLHYALQLPFPHLGRCLLQTDDETHTKQVAPGPKVVRVRPLCCAATSRRCRPKAAPVRVFLVSPCLLSSTCDVAGRQTEAGWHVAAAHAVPDPYHTELEHAERRPARGHGLAGRAWPLDCPRRRHARHRLERSRQFAPARPRAPCWSPASHSAPRPPPQRTSWFCAHVLYVSSPSETRRAC